MHKKIDIEVGPLFSSTAREIRGLDGKDGEMPSEEQLLDLIIPRIPTPLEGPVGPVGPKGEKGDRGPRGPAGEIAEPEEAIIEEIVKKHIKHGKDGKDFKFEDLTIAQKAALEGPRGVPGMQGPPGVSAESNLTQVYVTDPTYTLATTDNFVRVDTASNNVNITIPYNYPDYQELTIYLVDDTNTFTLTANPSYDGMVNFSGNLVMNYNFTSLYQCAVYFKDDTILFLK